MQNFENKLNSTEKLLKISGGIFDKFQVELKLKEIEITLQKDNFWKNKELAKKTIKKKFLKIS